MSQDVSSAIKTLVAYTKTEECPENIKDVFRNKYGVTVYSDNKFEVIYGLVTLYCVTRVLDNTSPSLLSPQLRRLLSIYFMEGINDNNARSLAQKTLNIGKGSLNSLNADLRKLGYTVKNPMRTGMDSLNQDLQDLRTYFVKHEEVPMVTIKLLSAG